MLKASLQESQQRPRGKHTPQPDQHVSQAPNMSWQRARTHSRESWPELEGLLALRRVSSKAYELGWRMPCTSIR